MQQRIIVRGAGDLATGVIQKLHRAGFQVLALEVAQPLCVRRTVSGATALATGSFQVEDLVFRRAEDPMDIHLAWAEGLVPLLVDPQASSIGHFQPLALVDSIMAKKNLGTHRDLAPITIGLGPGFQAPQEVDCVIETQRGHDLGRLIFDGQASANTGQPGPLGGQTWQRVLRAPGSGTFRPRASIGDQVQAGDLLAWVGEEPVRAQISGQVRGLLAPGLEVKAGLKVGDIDPRQDFDGLYRISDKARALGGAVLEAVLYLKRKKHL